MSSFDLLKECNSDAACDNNSNTGNLGNGNLKDECIIAFKVYDFCRIQECLTPDVLGPARAANDTTYCNRTVNAGDIIQPPQNAGSVTVENLKVKRVVVVNKKPNPFRPGFWDVELKFVFVYRLIFRDVNGNEICNVKAQSSFNNQITLFGSITTETLLSTDLFCSNGGSADLDADPFVLVESKAVSLSAEIRLNNCCCDTDDSLDNADISITIGLFAIIKLFRLVNLVVESRGFCIPDECEEVSSLDACEFFENLDFPLDIFAPPQRPEFVAGISSNIPNKRKSDSDCGCSKKSCGCNVAGSNSNNSCGCNSNSNCGCSCGCGCGR